MNQNLRYFRIRSSKINELDISLFMYQVLYLFLVTLYAILRVLLVQPGILLTVFIVGSVILQRQKREGNVFPSVCRSRYFVETEQSQVLVGATVSGYNPLIKAELQSMSWRCRGENSKRAAGILAYSHFLPPQISERLRATHFLSVTLLQPLSYISSVLETSSKLIYFQNSR